MVGQILIPLSVGQIGDVVHLHTIVVDTVQSLCWIRFRQTQEGFVLLVPDGSQGICILCHLSPLVLGWTLVSLREDYFNLVPYLRFDVVPQSSVQKRILFNSDHFFGQQVLVLTYSFHVIGLHFVLVTHTLGTISTCPSSVLFVPLGQTKNGFRTTSPRSWWHLGY